MTVTASSSTLSNIPTAQLGGKKKNGHKANCGCPICHNMKHSRKHRGGGEDSTTTSSSSSSTNSFSMGDDTTSTLSQTAGRRRRRGNGHKSSCGCPICQNMRHSKKRGGADEEDQQGDIEEGFASNDNTETSAVDSAITGANIDQEVEATSEDYDLNSAELGDAGSGTKAGGSRRRKRRSAKKSRKSRKTRRHKRRSHRR